MDYWPVLALLGIAGGALTAALGAKDAFGLGISLLAALAAAGAAVGTLCRLNRAAI